MSDPWKSDEPNALRARPASPEDGTLPAGLVCWENGGGSPQTVFECGERIVGVDTGLVSVPIELPEPAADPPPILDEFPRPGPVSVQIGGGLWIAEDLPTTLAHRIHRHARTLRAMERGTKHLISVVPLPEHQTLDPVALAQMCAHGAVEWAPIQIPLEDGWWPLGVGPDRESLVLGWTNRA